MPTGNPAFSREAGPFSFVKIGQCGEHGILTGGEQEQVEATICYFRDEVFTCSLLGSSAPYLKDTSLTDSLGSKEQAPSGDLWDSTPFRLQSEVTKETLSHSFGLPGS